ncbi:hypothetical protein TFLX_05462 [Thermoflexales bacterium]|nr:hypothetical protein TFLX_05462 [Thermoflexales bacterium]
MPFASLKHQARQQAQTLFDSLPSSRPEVITEEQVRQLPEPVQRFMHYTRTIGAPRARTVRLKQTGLFRISEKPNAKWYPLSAEQYYTTQPPAFVWWGSIQVAPLLAVQGLDVFHQHGSLVIKLLGLIKLADYRGPQADQAELVRYLSEIIWYPSACLHPDLHWQPIDQLSARATLTYHSLTVSGDFHFDEQGALTTFVAQRDRDFEGRPATLTWSARADKYRSFGDLFLPGLGEAYWHLPSGKFSYARLEVTEIEHNVSAVYSA